MDTMAIPELKTILKEMGIATKCRREDKLREILRKAILFLTIQIALTLSPKNDQHQISPCKITAF